MVDCLSELRDDELPSEIRVSSLILLDDDDWLIGIPLKASAAMWWGRYTTWCTAVDESFYRKYRENGHLIVFISRSEGGSWQLQPATGEFRNEFNKRVSWRGFVNRNPSILSLLITVLARINGVEIEPKAANGDAT